MELTVHNRPIGTNLKVRGHDMLWADTPPNLESLNSQTPLIRTPRGHRKCPYLRGVRIKRVEFREKM